MRRVVLFLFVVLTLCAHQITIPSTDFPPVIDGVGEDACWKNAAIVFGLTDSSKLMPMKECTVMKLVWKGDTLYGFVLCEQQHTEKFPPLDHPIMKKVYDTNCIEMFFWNGDVISQIILNYADGLFEQQLLPDPMLGVKNGSPFKSGIVAKSTLAAHSWTTEFALPLKSIGVKDGVFALNLIRNNLVEKEMGSWMCPGKLRGSWAALYKDYPRVTLGNARIPRFDVKGDSLTALEDLTNVRPDNSRETIKAGSVLTFDKEQDFVLRLECNGKICYEYSYLLPERITMDRNKEIDWPVIRLSPFMPCQLFFYTKHSFPVKPEHEADGKVINDFELVFDLPDGVSLADADKTDGASPGRVLFVRKLAYIKRVYNRNRLTLTFACELPPGSKGVLRYHFRWPEGRTPVHELPFESIEVKPAAQPKKILVGVYGAHDKWTEDLSKVGLNCMESAFYSKSDNEIREVRRLADSGFKTIRGCYDDFPFGAGKAFSAWTEKDRSSRARDIDGYYIVNKWSKGYQISPSYRGKRYQECVEKTVDFCRKAGFRHFEFDTEDYWQPAGNLGDFCDRTIQAFEKWFAEKHPDMQYISPKEFEREPDKHPEHHKAWIDFKCWIWADFFAEIKRRLATDGPVTFYDYGMREVTEQMCHERLTNHHWLKVFDGGIGGGWYSGVDKSTRGWMRNYQSMRDQWNVDPRKAVWISPARLVAHYAVTTCKPVKDEMKCLFFEALSIGARGIWVYYQPIMDMDAARQLSDGIRVLNKCEDIVYDGTRIADISTDVPYWDELTDYFKIGQLLTRKNEPKVLVKGLEHQGRALITVSEYREQIPREANVRYKVTRDCKVRDLETDEVIATMRAGDSSFKVNLDADRCCRILLVE